MKQPLSNVFPILNDVPWEIQPSSISNHCWGGTTLNASGYISYIIINNYACSRWKSFIIGAMTYLIWIILLPCKLKLIPNYENRLGIDRDFGRKFGSALFFVRNYSTYCLSESSAEVRPNRKFGLSLLHICMNNKILHTQK